MAGGALGRLFSQALEGCGIIKSFPGQVGMRLLTKMLM